jgi:hypothetical protein
MNVRLLVVAGAVGLLLAFGMMAGACKNGGGGALTLEEFFQRVDELDSELNEQSDALFASLEDTQDPAEAVEQLRDIFPQQAGLFQDFRDDLADLDPPAEAESLHHEALEAFDGVIAAVDGLVGQLDSVESLDDLDALFVDSEFSAADERLTQVCLDLEQLAADNGITVDFNCEDESDGTDGGDTSALEDYFQELDGLENVFRVSGDAADAAFAALEATAPVADAVAVLEDAVAGIDEFVAGLEGLDPPADAAPFHDETIAGFGVVSEILHDVIDNAGQYATLDEFFAFFNDPGLIEADDSLDGSCAALQSVADSNGIAVDLDCED